MVSANSLRNLDGISSAPGALYMPRFCNSFLTPFSFTVIDSMSGMLLAPDSGIASSVSVLSIDLKCLFRISTLDLSSVYVHTHSHLLGLSICS